MIDLLPPLLHQYCENHTSQENELLQEISRYTHLHVMMPQMLSGHLQGAFLSMISKMIRPRYILEIGTYTGYTALCLAEGLVSDGQLYSLDINKELHHKITPLINKSPYAQQINLISGNAIDTIETLPYDWGLVFIDADKQNYLNYYKQIRPKMRSGTWIIADNVLWSGKVIDDNKDKDTIAICEFNDYVMNDSGVKCMLLPLRDGLLLIHIL